MDRYEIDFDCDWMSPVPVMEVNELGDWLKTSEYFPIQHAIEELLTQLGDKPEYTEEIANIRSMSIKYTNYDNNCAKEKMED